MYLITGFPRPLSRHMAQAILARTPDSEVTLLTQEHHATDAGRFAATLAENRARVLAGDAASMHLGLSTAEYKELSQSCTDVVHAAEWSGTDRMTLERVNVEGTRAVIELAQDCKKLRRLTHFSTAFVSGDRAGVVAEDELSAGQAFRNAYEQTRFEAEILVRRAMGALPCTVLRPPVVIGDGVEGPPAIALLLVTSPLPVPLPGDGVAPLHAVPIDFVVQAASAIHHDPRAVGRTFHLVDPNPASVRRVSQLVVQREGKQPLRPSLGSRLTEAALKLSRLGELRGSGLTSNLVFYSSRNTVELLEGTGIRCPPIESYIDKLIDQARDRLREP